MAIGNKRYIHFNAQKHQTIRQNIGGGVGHSLCCPPTKLLWGRSLLSPVSAPVVQSSRKAILAIISHTQISIKFGLEPYRNDAQHSTIVTLANGQNTYPHNIFQANNIVFVLDVK